MAAAVPGVHGGHRGEAIDLRADHPEDQEVSASSQPAAHEVCHYAVADDT